jgi:hypothetical protein
MGRRIYDIDGEYVWKYTFGRQPSEMDRISNEMKIGEYVSETNIGDNLEDEYEDNYLNLKYSDLKLLKVEYKKLLNKHTEKFLYAEGMKALNEYIDKQDKTFNKIYKDDIKNIKNSKSHLDFRCYGVNDFEIYDIYAKGIEKYLKCSFDYLCMVKSIIEYMSKNKKKEYCLIDEL